jgi:hypothetical protein
MIASGDVRHHVVEHEYPQTLFIKLEWSFLLLLTGNSTISLKIVPRKDGLVSSNAYDVYLGLLTGQKTFLLTGTTVIPNMATDSQYDFTLGVESGAAIQRMRAHMVALDPGTYEFKISVGRDPPAHGITRYCGQFIVRAAGDGDSPLIIA